MIDVFLPGKVCEQEAEVLYHVSEVQLGTAELRSERSCLHNLSAV